MFVCMLTIICLSKPSLVLNLIIISDETCIINISITFSTNTLHVQYVISIAFSQPIVSILSITRLVIYLFVAYFTHKT